MTEIQVLNTKGAARRLGCSETWIHKLVSASKLKAYIYDDSGMLVEHRAEEKRQGQGLYFLASDVDLYQPAVQRRPRGSKNKKTEETGASIKTA
jgi:hypothetical protein